jgi:hypothetical protein
MAMSQLGLVTQALASTLFVLSHPASSEPTKEAARVVRGQLETHLSPGEIEAIQGNVRDENFDEIIQELLKTEY